MYFFLSRSLDTGGGGGNGRKGNAEDLDMMRRGLLMSSTWAWIRCARGELGGVGLQRFHTEMTADCSRVEI